MTKYMGAVVYIDDNISSEKALFRFWDSDNDDINDDNDDDSKTIIMITIL